MATKRTACEEAADILDRNPTYSMRFELPKDLRAEGRELKRLRKLVVDVATKAWLPSLNEQIEREAARIQKARTK